MYQNNNNTNWDKHRQENQQRKLQQQKIQQDYKSRCEHALDNIVFEFQNSQINNLKDWMLNSSDKAAVTRYYKRYWANRYFTFSSLVMMFTFFASFYTVFAVFGIAIVFVLKQIFSQNTFLRYFLNDHELSQKDIQYLKNKLFGNQLEMQTVFIVTFVSIVISYVISFYSINFYVDFEAHQKLIELLSKWYPFQIGNELFAYVNTIFIFSLMSLKIFEKWR